MADMAISYVKFTAHFTAPAAIDPRVLQDFNTWRDPLRQRHLIGVYSDGPFAGVGFGNMSVRSPHGFIVTASGTGGRPTLAMEDLTEVIHVDPEHNCVRHQAASPAVCPSAECMSHHAFYEADARIGAVVHVHHLALWESLLNLYPTTAEAIPYGTPEMGREIRRLFLEERLSKRGVAVTAGHREGLFASGANLAEAAGRLLRLYDSFNTAA